MASERAFIATILIESVPDLSGTLKRLALFCDEIRFFLPSARIVHPQIMDDPSRTVKHEDGTVQIRPFNYLEDTGRDLEIVLESFIENLERDADRETLQGLVDAGIATTIDARILDKERLQTLEKIRGLLIQSDVRDPAFNAISETKPEDYAGRIPLTRITLGFDDRPPGEPREMHVWTLPEPNAIADSYELTNSLLIAECCGYSPVFPLPRHRKELDYRYAQYQQGLKIYAQQTGCEVPAASFGWKFAECAYLLSNALFTSELIERKPVSDIIRYRGALKETRRRFVNQHLFELTALIEETPWNQKAHEEVDKFYLNNLYPDLCTYQDECQETWEKLFGSLAVHATSALTGAVVGTAGGGMLGSVIPGTGAWGLLALGALVGVAKEAPKVADSLVDFVTNLRKEKRNSIAYLAQFK